MTGEDTHAGANARSGRSKTAGGKPAPKRGVGKKAQSSKGAGRKSVSAERAKQEAARPARDRADTETIGLDELVRRLADPDEPEKELIPYLTARQDQRVGLAPVLLPNENVRTDGPGAAQARARGEIGLGFLNYVYQARRRRRFERRLAAGNQRPVLMAEGDSWFQYPVFLADVVDHLDSDYNIFCVSAAGAELRTMVAEAEYRDHLARLFTKGVQFQAFLFSGAGNDVVGDRMRALIRPFDPSQDAVGHVDAEAFEQKMARIVLDFEAMIASVRSVLPAIPILLHGYDYSVPLPKQEFSIPPRDGWLGAPMRALGIPDGRLQTEIVRVMMDLVNDELRKLAGGNIQGGRHDRVFFVDNRNVVQDRWADELHPDDNGFKDVAKNFRRVMKDAEVP